MNRLPLAALLLTAAAPLTAQTAGEWHTRYDRPGTADTAMKVAAMAPGWHVTTSPPGSGIAWKASQTASGNFTAELETSLFPGSGTHLEGYGMILGGRDLDGPDQSYLYFLVRKDGAFLIKHRAGDATHDILTWTPSPAVAKQEGTTNAHNVLTVQARADSVTFLVNGRRVYAIARTAASVDGIVGLRVNHGLIVHVTRLDVRREGR